MDCHIQNIVKGASNQLSMLRKLFTLSRQNLDKMTLPILYPCLEDACELWDDCTHDDTNKIERVQHEATRIVTGLPKYANIDSLYFETGWETLQSRRKRRKLSLFYKIHHQDCPSYLNDCLSPYQRDVRQRNLRTDSDYRQPFTRLQLFSNSFFPSAIRLWNNLESNIRNLLLFYTRNLDIGVVP